MRSRARIAVYRRSQCARASPGALPTQPMQATSAVKLDVRSAESQRARLDLQVDALDLVLDALQALHLLLLALPLLGQLRLLRLQPLQRLVQRLQPRLGRSVVRLRAKVTPVTYPPWELPLLTLCL